MDPAGWFTSPDLLQVGSTNFTTLPAPLQRRHCVNACSSILYVLCVLKEPSGLRRRNTTRLPLTTTSRHWRPWQQTFTEYVLISQLAFFNDSTFYSTVESFLLHKVLKQKENINCYQRKWDNPHNNSEPVIPIRSPKPYWRPKTNNLCWSKDNLAHRCLQLFFTLTDTS